MAQAPRRKTYRIRYDRIIFVLAILAVLILILTSCISSCAKKDDGEKDSSVQDDMSATDTISNSSGQSVSITTTEPPKVTYATVSLNAEDVYRGDLVLFNAAHPSQFDASGIAAGTSDDVQFVTIKSVLDTKSEKHYTAKDWEVGIDKDAANAMDAWLEAFYEQSGNTDIRMIAGYSNESEDLDYRTGRTLKLGIFPDSGSSYFYKAEGTFAWAAENAKNYGFILRYPEGKESFFDDTITSNTTATFRYVGIPAATYITDNNLCLEEYLESVKSYTIDNMLKVTNGTTTYGMYYAAANPNGTTEISVPANEDTYEISGNNMDGFVVTVTLDESAPAPTEADTTAPTETTTPDAVG